MDVLDLSVEEIILLKKLKQKNPEIVKSIIESPSNSNNELLSRQSAPPGANLNIPNRLRPDGRTLKDLSPQAPFGQRSYPGRSGNNDQFRFRDMLPMGNFQGNFGGMSADLFKDPYYQRLATKMRNTRAIAVDNKIIYEALSGVAVQGINLYVANLEEDMNDSDLESLFSPFGKILEFKIHRDPATGKSRKIGFVKFQQKSSADKAIAQLHDTQPEGFSAPIQVKLAISRKRSADVMKNLDFQPEEGHVIFVYNLHFDTENTAIYKLFGPFGAILNVKIVRNPETKKCVGYGFVQMRCYEEAEFAIRSLDGMMLNNRKIEVRFKKNKIKVPKFM